MKAREMATNLITKLSAISDSDEPDDVLIVKAIDAVEEFADELLKEAHARASTTIENAMVGVRFDHDY